MFIRPYNISILFSQSTSSIATEKIESVQTELAQIKEENVQLSKELETLKVLIDNSDKEHKDLLQDFEKVQSKATDTDTEFAAFKNAQELAIKEYEREKVELSLSRDHLQVEWIIFTLNDS